MTDLQENTNQEIARRVASSLPTCEGPDDEGELISLCDIVVTAMETPWTHWRTRLYDPDADGSATHPWAIVEALAAGLPEGSLTRAKPIFLTEQVVRDGVAAYLKSRLDRGMDLVEAMKLVDGVYTDAKIADSIVQFVIYEQEVFS